MVQYLKQGLLGAKMVKQLNLKLIQSHSAWTGGKQKLMDKGRISKFNKKISKL